MKNDAVPELADVPQIARAPAALWGLLPLVVVGFAASALLWGTGHELPFGGDWGPTRGATQTREAVGWLAGLGLVLLLAYPLLGVAARWLRGHWPRQLVRLTSWSQRRQRDRCERLLSRDRQLIVPAIAQALLAEQADFAVAATRSEFRRADQPQPPLLDETIASAFRDEEARLVTWLERHQQDQKLDWHDLRVHVTRAGLSRARSAAQDKTFAEILSRVQARLDAGKEAAPRGAPRMPALETPARLRFPYASDLLPTALGNVEAAVADRIAERYALNLAAAWPRLAVLLPERTRPALAAAERRLDVPIFLSAGWGIATVGGVLAAVFYFGASPALVAGAIGSGILCRATYHQALERAIDHGRLVESAVDIHRLALLDAVGWRRPVDAVDERNLFSALSSALSGGEVDERFRRAPTNAEPDSVVASMNSTIEAMVAGLPGQLSATVKDSVSRAVGRSIQNELTPVVAQTVERTVTRGLDATLQPAIESTLRSAVAGPRLVNYSGHLSAMIRDQEGPVLIDDDRKVRLVGGREYELVVAIGASPRSEGVAVPLRIRNGEDAADVAFAIEVESNGLRLDEAEKEVTVGSGREEEACFPIGLDRHSAEPAWLWIRITQQGRTIQNLELRAAAAGTE